MTPEALARLFHETYEALAPVYSYQTRPASAVPWDEVPEDNRKLMIATAEVILERLDAEDAWANIVTAAGTVVGRINLATGIVVRGDVRAG
jgi:hypothetical protein